MWIRDGVFHCDTGTGRIDTEYQRTRRESGRRVLVGRKSEGHIRKLSSGLKRRPLGISGSGPSAATYGRSWRRAEA